MQTQSNKKVCLVVNCFNSEKYLQTTLNSLVKQTHRNLIILCIDNNSADNTKDIISDFIKTDDRIIYHKLTEHYNLVDARIYATSLIKKMRGINYFGFCDSDDLWAPTWVSSLLEVSDGYDILFSNGYELYEKSQYREKVERGFSNHKNDAFSSPIYLQSALISVRLLQGQPIFDKRLQNIYDLDFFVGLRKQNTKYIHISDYLFTYRVHPNSLSKNNKIQICLERWIVTKKQKFSKIRFVIKYCFIIFGLYRIRNMFKSKK